ncbi:MAG: AAA-like domain-containing protein [Spirochaetales bacterium]|nr:AAA-like domain-containing protein [Spirochaetales bacterium]
MAKKFNVTGICIPGKHYMVDTASKIEKAIAAIEEGDYITINYPRQFGKTTTLLLLERELEKRGFLPISISFEGIGDAVFEDEKIFSRTFIRKISEVFNYSNKELAEYFLEKREKIENFDSLSQVISQSVIDLKKKIVLLIDEIDKSSNNQLFLSFLGMLREKYLRRSTGKDFTFQSVILAGVYDVKSLKMKIREGKETKYNSPWNIAIDYPGDLSFTPEEIETMLAGYSTDKNISMDIPAIAAQLYSFTSGYPFLVSRLCSIIDADIMKKSEPVWSPDFVDRAVARILLENNTNFESLIKNLENNDDLYTLVKEILLNDSKMEYNEDNSLIKLGAIHGIFKQGEYLQIHNKIYRERIYNYMSLNLKIESLLNKNLENYNFKNQFLLPENTLDFEKILLRFQAFMKEQYSVKDKAFVERNWRLLYIAFIKPIINGHGFDFKETQISEEKRIDVVITFYNRKYISELKIWGGREKHSRGLKQLTDYLERQHVNKGYLIIFDFKKAMEYKQEKKSIDGRDIFIVWV